MLSVHLGTISFGSITWRISAVVLLLTVHVREKRRGGRCVWWLM